MAMVSERIQRQVDALLDKAEEAVNADDWAAVRQYAIAVLRFDSDNEDAQAFLEAANADVTVEQRPSPPQTATTPDTSAPSLPSFFVAGRYRVERFLGAGGRKRVFLAHDTTLDRDVAFAQIRTEGLDDLARERVMREAQSMARLGAHPNLVAIHDIGEENGNPHLVEEFMAGGTVASLLLEDGTPEVERTLAVATDVCRALSFMHGQGLIHRDLKPANIFLAEDGTAKVGDFGLAVALDRSRITQQGSLVGTTAYMPPEQALGGEVSPQSDLYALGAMLYELLTGRPPSAGDDPTAVISQHINTPPVAPSWHTDTCPPALEELILHCLRKDPADRPASADAVLASLSVVDPSETSPGHTDSNPLDSLARGVFVGREAEMQRLRDALDAAISGDGSLMMLVGEPGSGKTRTVQELETYARIRGADVLTGRALESEATPPYWPWIEVAQAAVEKADAAGQNIDAVLAAELKRIVPELADHASGADSDSVDDPESAQFRLFQAYARFIASLAQTAPLMIVLDDLHLADRGSLSLFAHVVRSLPRKRILIVGTYCDAQVSRGHPLSTVVAELRQGTAYDRVRLGGLDQEAVGRALTASVASDVPRSLAEAVHRRTDGNPLFVQEILRHVVEEGRFSRGADGISATAASLEHHIPEGLREVVALRLAKLSPATGELLGIAAVIGDEFELETLRAVSGLSAGPAEAALDEATSTLICEERPQLGGAAYRFTHTLFREVLYEDLIVPRRIGLHLRVAHAIESRYAERLEARAAELAEHYGHSSDPVDLSKAVDFGKRAARHSSSVFAHGDTVHLLEHALRVQAVLDPADGRARCDLLLELGNALLAADRPHRAESEVAEEAFALADAARMDEAAAEACSIALRGLAGVSGAPTIQSPRGQAWLARSQRQPADTSLRALRDVSVAYAETGEQRSQDLRRALDTARDLGEPEAFHFAAWACFSGANLDRSAEDALIEEVSARAGDDIWTGWRACSVGTAGSIRMARQDRDGAEELFAAVAAMHEQAPGGLVTGHWIAAEVGRLAMDGHLEEAVSLATSERLESGRPWVRMMMTRPMLQIGRAREYLDSERTPGPWDAHIYAMAGIEPEARAALAATSVDAQPLGPALMALDGAILLGDRDKVRGLTDRVLEIWAPLVTLTWETVTDRHVGEAFAYLGDADEARERYGAALEVAQRMRWRPEIALIRFDLAKLLLGYGDGHHAEALDALTFAAGEFAEMKMLPHTEEATRVRLELQGAAAADVRTSLDVVAAAVQTEHPDLAPQAAPDGTVTLLFSDIIDSTATNERLGDTAWMALLHEHNAVIREHVAANNGYEVKSMGDGFMLAFGSAKDGLNCAIGIQRAITARNESADEPVEIRIGLHTGEAVQEQGDFFGKHVNLAARIGGSATGGEILVSSLLAQLVGPSGEFTLSERPSMPLKGLDGEHVTHGVAWR